MLELVVGFDRIGQDRHISCPGSRAGAPVCQGANSAVAVIRYSWCLAVDFMHACRGWLRVCCWALMCCVRAGHVAAVSCGRKTTHDTSRRTRDILVDRSNNSPFCFIAFGAVGVFILLSVLGVQIQIGSKLICHTD